MASRWLLVAAFGCVLADATCGAPPECGPRVRRGWSMLTCEERNEYIDAVVALRSLDISGYQDFARMHLQATNYAHGTSAFLPWHRWYTLGYENALRSVPGYECITVPYWDWERDDNDESMSMPFRAKTFGTTKGIAPGGCVTDGAFAGWNTSDGKCLKRTWDDRFSFTGTMEMASIIISNNKYADFSEILEGNPHAAPHVYVGGYMGTMRSPDDPLFFIHHANIDRMWALWQDYHGYDTVSKNAITSDMYQPRGSWSGDPSASDLELDDEIVVDADGRGRRLPYFSAHVTFRDVQDITDMPGVGNSYTYGLDNLANVIGSVSKGSWDLVIPGALPKLPCCGDGTVDKGTAETCDDGNTANGDGCSATCKSETTISGTSTIVAGQVFSDAETQKLYEKADMEREITGGDKAAMLKELAMEECKMHASKFSNTFLASLAQRMMTGKDTAQFFEPCGSL